MTATTTPQSTDVEVASTPSLREIVLTHGDYVWRLLRYLGVAERDLDDVCQDVFTTVYKKLDHLRDDGLRPWLHAMCFQHSRNYRRRASRQREILVTELPELVAPASQEETVDQARAQELMLIVLDRLDEDKRAIFVLHAIEGLPMGEVAKLVGCSVSTAYLRFQHARQELEKRMVRK